MKQTLVAVLLSLSMTTVFAQEAAHAPTVGAGADSSAATASAPASKAHVLTRAELDKLLTHPQDLLLIDVRRPDEVSQIGGLPVYLSVQLSDLEKSVEWIPKGRTIVTVSNHAKRAGTAADLLASKGFKVAGAVGVQTYEEEGGKLTKVAIPPHTGQSAAATASANGQGNVRK